MKKEKAGKGQQLLAVGQKMSKEAKDDKKEKASADYEVRLMAGAAGRRTTGAWTRAKKEKKEKASADYGVRRMQGLSEKEGRAAGSPGHRLGSRPGAQDLGERGGTLQ